jgi:hypothetical protein
MSAYDDLDYELDRNDNWRAPDRARQTRLAAIATIVVIAAMAGGFTWWLRSRNPAPPAPGKSAAQALPSSATSEARPAAVLPPLDELDPTARNLIRELTTSPALARWLATDNLTRQMAAMLEGVVSGQLPGRLLAPLRPEGTFEVVTRGGRTTIAPESYARYDALASAIAALDATAVARVYHTLSPRLDEARHELADSEQSIDEAVAAALTRLIETPIPQEPVAVHGQAGMYFFADRRLEALSPAQKLLLRSGPDNAARIQAKLREVARALGVTPSAAPPPTP